MNLQGKVTSGLGTAKMWVGKVEKAFKERINIKLYNGTLNIKLEEDYIVKPDFIIFPEEYGGTQKVLVQSCKIFGKKAYIVRAEKNQIGQGDHNLQIIEIVSDVKLRDAYSLKDNQELSIEI